MRKPTTINSVSIQDFFSVAGVDFQLPKRGFFLVEGENRDEASCKKSNGSGKSTLYEAILWCLFGRTLRDISNTDAVVRTGSSAAQVSVSLEVEDGAKYTVERTRFLSPRKSRLSLRRGTEDVSGPSIAETQKKIEGLLGADLKMFCSAVVFGGSSTLKFTSLSPKERRAILDDAVGASLYEKASLLVKEERRRAEFLRDEAARDHSATVERLREAREELREYRAEASAHGVDEERMSKLLKIIAKKRRVIRHLRETRDSLEEWKGKLRDLENRIARASSRLEKAGTQITDAERTLDMFAKATCSLCGSKISWSEEQKIQQRERVASLSEERRKQTNVISKLTAIVSKTMSLARRHEEDLAKLEKTMLQIRLAEREQELLEERYDFAPRLRKLQSIVKNTRGLVKTTKIRARTEEKKVASLLLLENSFSPELVVASIEHAVPELDRKAKEVAQILSEGVTRVSFDTGILKRGREELGVGISSSYGAQNYEASSQGEKALIDIVAGTAIQHVMAGKFATNAVFYDEVFDNLDSVASGRVLSLLRKQAKEKAVFLITHRDDLSMDAFDGIVRMIKEKGATRMLVSTWWVSR